MFDRKGVIIVENNDDLDEEALIMDALEAGAEDVEDSDEIIEIFTDPSSFSSVRDALEEGGYKFLSAGVEMVAQNTVKLSQEEAASVEAMIEKLEDNDDAQNVFHNLEIV
jgi:transcriptional/translational regulatory protein YebC/TACO1